MLIFIKSFKQLRNEEIMRETAQRKQNLKSKRITAFLREKILSK